MYWLTNTGVSSARLYWENKADFFDTKPITIPFAISVFPDELYQAPRSWAERAYPGNLIYYNRVDRGGHFAAWEQPDTVMAEPGETASTPIAAIQRVSDEDGAAECTFCGKPRYRVAAMASAGDVAICVECLELCDEILT